MNELTFDLEDLELDELSVTSMHDAVALPETGTSGPGHPFPGSSSCCSCIAK